jgi:hypothetical protein
MKLPRTVAAVLVYAVLSATPASAWDPVLHDGAIGAALGCVIGRCQGKNVGLGAAAGVLGFPVIRQVLGSAPSCSGPGCGSYAPDHADPCAAYPDDSVQRQKCVEGALRARQRDYEESVRRAERDGYCAVRPRDRGYYRYRRF